jgi:HSP20 family protein
MSLIPFRTKRSSGMEPASLATISDFRNEMNRLFEGFLNRPAWGASWFETAEPGVWMPAIDMQETDAEIHVRAELPGIDPKDVDVSVSEDRLLISGEKKSEAEQTTDGWTHRESHYGSFSRAIPLPEAVDPAKVTARYDKGVLTVELKKSPTSTSRKVPVLTK